MRSRYAFDPRKCDPVARALANFFRHVDIPDDGGCWIWRGGLARKRWGMRPKMHFGGREDKRTISPARFILLLYDTVPASERAGVHACHTCDNVLCVNWRHLFWGTQSENEQDWVSKYGRKGDKARAAKAGAHSGEGEPDASTR